MKWLVVLNWLSFCQCASSIFSIPKSAANPLSSRHLQFPPLSADVENCPLHPSTVDLPPGPDLPEAIRNAISSVQDQLKKLLNNDLPGVAFSVVYKDSVLTSAGLGTKIKGQSTLPDGKTIFRIGSVTKVFTVLMLYQMVEKGYIKSLDEHFVDYCQNFSMQTEFNITLRQMAAQMSGLPREAPCSGLTPENFCPFATKEILARLKSQRLINKPWTIPSYSNLAYALLGRCLVEHFFPTTTYEEFVQKNILEPLNMSSTGFQITESIKTQMATGYLPDGTVAPLADLGWIGPAGQMYSTTDDLNKLAQFFMSAHINSNSSLKSARSAYTVLSESMRNEMLLQVYINRDQKSGFGTPWEFMFLSNYTIASKGGNVGGYSALLSFVPELQLGLNILFSGAADEFSAVQDAYSTLIPAFVSELSKRRLAYPYPPNPKVYEGKFNAGQLNMTTVTTISTPLGPQLLLSGSLSVYLSYVEPYLFQIDFPDDLLPCLNGELLGIRKQWVYFTVEDSSGLSPSFTIPGFNPYIVFTRVK